MKLPVALSTWRSISRRSISQFVGLAILACGLVLLNPPTASGFCPNNGHRCGFGLVGTTHKDMTKRAVKELDEEFFGTDHLTKSMKNAIEEIWMADAEVDLNQTDGFWHFDGESFLAAKARVSGLREGVIQALEAKNGPGARDKLGQALHTLQDFYAHSNYIESGGRGANPAIWQPGTSFGTLAAPTEPTCEDCEIVVDPMGGVFIDCTANIITPNLTSGYYGGENEKPQVNTKCRHGGILDDGPGAFGGINKDVIFATFSPHNFFHFTAAGSAEEATKAFIRDIKDQITARQLKLLLGVGPTLAFAIDTTGSMGSVISQVRSQAIQIVDNRIDTDQEPLLYVLAPFNDPFIGPLTVTDDAGDFKRAIGALRASGGGDCPEFSMAGQILALGAADKGVDLFTFTDADPKDAGRAGNVSSLAAEKEAEIYPMLNSSCSFLTDPNGANEEALGLASATDPASFTVNPSYRRIADDSGGQLFVLSSSEIGTVTQLADAAVRANAVDLLSVADVLPGGSISYTVPVDSTLERVTFSLSGFPNLVLTRPDGTTVAPGDPGVSVIPLSTASIVTILTPQTGDWTAATTGSGSFSLNILGESPVDLDRFDFVEISGRLAHQGLFNIQGFPVISTASTVAAEMSGDVSTADFELRTKAGELIQTLDLTQEEEGDPDEYFGELTLPSGPFLVYVTGLLPNGERYQRARTTKVQPQTVRIQAPPGRALAPGQTAFVEFVVENLGAANTFRFTATDDQFFLRTITPSVFALGTGGTQTVTVELLVRTTAVLGSTDTLTATVESLAPTGALNFAVVDNFIADLTSVDCTQAQPSVDQLWPPNHDLVPVDVLGVTSSDGGAVTIRIDGILQSEATNGLGDGDTCPDGQGIGSSTALVRSERSGTDGGRTYTILFTGSNAAGSTCTGSVSVCVPHNRSGGCEPAAAPFDSTACP